MVVESRARPPQAQHRCAECGKRRTPPSPLTLPAELLPADWPGEAMRGAVSGASMSLVPAVQTHLRQLMPVAHA